MAAHIDYYDDEGLAALRTCACGWSGTFQQMGREIYRELMDGSCPKCKTMLVIVSFPTVEETRAAAAQGNTRAIAALASAEKTAARAARAKKLELRNPEQLPDLRLDRPTRFVWDQVEREGDRWIDIRVAGTSNVIWRQLAYWEGIDAFTHAEDVLRRRYGDLFAALVVTPASTDYLWGDMWSSYRRLEEATPDDLAGSD